MYRAILGLTLLLGSPVPFRHSYGIPPLLFGVQTSVWVLAEVKSENRDEFPEELDLDASAVVFVYEQFWFGLPWWTQRGVFGICEVDGSGRRVIRGSPVWRFSNQGKANISRLTGVPESALKIPLLYRLPLGWLLVIALSIIWLGRSLWHSFRASHSSNGLHKATPRGD